MTVLLTLFKRNRFPLAATLGAALLSNLSQMFYILLVGELVNKIASRENIELTFLSLLAAFMLSNAITLFIDQYVGRMTAEKLAHSLRMAYARRLLKKSAGEGETYDTGAAMSVAQNELAQADAYLGNTFFSITGNVFSGILVLIFLIFQNVLLTMVLLIPAILILLYVIYSGRKLTPLVSAAQNEKSRMNRAVYSTVHAFPAVKIFGGEDLSIQNLDETMSGWTLHAAKLGRRSALYNTLSGILSRIPLLLLLCVGTYMVIDGSILLGTLIVFLNLQKSLTQFIMNLPSWLSGFKIFTTNLSRIEII